MEDTTLQGTVPTRPPALPEEYVPGCIGRAAGPPDQDRQRRALPLGHPTVRAAATTGMFARCRFGGHRHDLKP